MGTYFEGDTVIYGDESTRQLGVIERIDYKDMKIGIRRYYTETGHVEYWIRPDCITRCLNRYHVGDKVYCAITHGFVEIIGIGRSFGPYKCWYKVQSIHSKAIYSQIEEEDLNEHILPSATENPFKQFINGYVRRDGVVIQETQLRIDKVIFNDPATIIIWKDGTKTVVKTAPGETYSKWAGMALCISKKLYGDRFHRIFKEYCGEEEEKEESSAYPWKEWHKSLVDICKNMATENKGGYNDEA